ncbi:MAG: hypothetical protein ACREVR_15545 [Burkholderiales bacterium]
MIRKQVRLRAPATDIGGGVCLRVVQRSGDVTSGNPRQAIENQGGKNAFKGGYIFTAQNGFDLSRGAVSVLTCLNGTSELVNWNPVVAAARAVDWSGAPDLFPLFGMPSL